ncbi:MULTISPECIES: dihydrofolate reductase family protein [unclassified Micromonospora]|uniref:dihydrofolate reductase family protein n=1 Tax=unclassified Micromonospora TaxID=2617518 RepID=UPI00331AB129
MTLTQYFVAMSIDGYIAEPAEQLDWLSQFSNLEGKRRRYERFFDEVGAIAMGARSYEFICRHNAPWFYGDRPTWVFTHRSLPHDDGADLRFTDADVTEVHPQLVEAAKGKNVWILGGAELASQFVRADLVDELHIGVAPVLVGSGTRLLHVKAYTPWALAETNQYGSFLALRYVAPGRDR